MKFYDETKPLYIEITASGVGIGSCPPTNKKWYKWSKR